MLSKNHDSQNSRLSTPTTAKAEPDIAKDFPLDSSVKLPPIPAGNAYTPSYASLPGSIHHDVNELVKANLRPTNTEEIKKILEDYLANIPKMQAENSYFDDELAMQNRKAVQAELDKIKSLTTQEA